ncbi:MAG: SH3 domain-containing protein [Candidatus Omnitrophota bacterium]
MIKVIISILSSIFLISCSTPPKIDSFYSIPAVSYLRECPNYDCAVVTEVYNADRVRLLGKNDTGWWQVQSLRDQKTGWTQRDLLSEAPIVAKNYYVTVDGLPLRDSPGDDVISRNLLAYGDKVQKIAEKDNWWRVLVEKDKSIGWIPATQASEKWPVPSEMEKSKSGESDQAVKGSPTATPPVKPGFYFVAAETLNLYLLPLDSSQVVKVLILNDKVETISQHGSDWFKVRYRATGAEGWVQARFLKEFPVTKKTQIVAPLKKSRQKAPGRKHPSQEPSETLEPEGM